MENIAFIIIGVWLIYLELVARDLLVRHLIERRPTLNVELFAVEAVDVRTDLCKENTGNEEDDEERMKRKKRDE